MSPPEPAPPAEASSIVTRPLWLVTIAYVLYWLQLLGHEAGHALGRILFTGDADLTRRWPLRVQIATFGGGPLFTFALMGVAVAVAMRARSARARMIAVIVGLTAASRSVSIVPKSVAGMPTDERALSQFLGVPYLLIAGSSWSSLSSSCARSWWRSPQTRGDGHSPGSSSLSSSPSSPRSPSGRPSASRSGTSGVRGRPSLNTLFSPHEAPRHTPPRPGG